MTKASEIKRLCADLTSDLPKIGKGRGKEYEVREYLRNAVYLKENWGGDFYYSDDTCARLAGVQPAIKLRGAPGLLEASTGRKYTHFKTHCRTMGCELHMSLQCQGESRAGHELDICLVSSRDRVKASKDRQRYLDMPICYAIECKDYGVGSASKHMLRSSALTKVDHRIFVYSFVTNKDISGDGKVLLEHYGVELKIVT